MPHSAVKPCHSSLKITPLEGLFSGSGHMVQKRSITDARAIIATEVLFSGKWRRSHIAGKRGWRPSSTCPPPRPMMSTRSVRLRLRVIRRMT